MPTVIDTRAETPQEEALRQWYDQQRLEAPKLLEEAARLIVGLITGLLGVLFGVLTVAAEKLPGYLSLAGVRWAGALAVALWLISLLAGLAVLVPRRWRVKSAQPGSQEAVFQRLRAYKAKWLSVCAVAFGLGVATLGGVLIVAIFSA